MARTVAELPPGARIKDYNGLGVISKTFPLSAIESALSKTGRASIRQRDLPAPVVVYYVIVLALYMQSSYREVLRCLLEAVQWLRDRSAGIRVAGKSGISQAHTRLGWEPLRQLHDELVKPLADRSTRGAWYRSWRLVSLDGGTFDVADEKANEVVFSLPGARRARRGGGTSVQRLKPIYGFVLWATLNKSANAAHTLPKLFFFKTIDGAMDHPEGCEANGKHGGRNSQGMPEREPEPNEQPFH